MISMIILSALESYDKPEKMVSKALRKNNFSLWYSVFVVVPERQAASTNY
jgi:hypothetical protein